MQVIIGNPDLKANHNITQHIEVLSDFDKMTRLRELLKSIMTEPGAKVLIFCETKRGCDEITRTLRMDGWPALALHGDKSQKERDWVLLEFKSNRHPLMLATDVAARGLGRQGGGSMTDFKRCLHMHCFSCIGSLHTSPLIAHKTPDPIVPPQACTLCCSSCGRGVVSLHGMSAVVRRRPTFHYAACKTLGRWGG
jgi:hypothetical protein